MEWSDNENSIAVIALHFGVSHSGLWPASHDSDATNHQFNEVAN